MKYNYRSNGEKHSKICSIQNGQFHIVQLGPFLTLPFKKNKLQYVFFVLGHRYKIRKNFGQFETVLSPVRETIWDNSFFV